MENIKKAPASITVVTDRQIRQMGATALYEVLRIVPGFSPAMLHLNSYNYLGRGLVAANSNSILLLINSHPVNEARFGGFNWVHDTLITDNIKRIEFIRGPGSALYGTNALDGVINIITKDAEDIEGFELTTRGGSWDTQQHNLLYGKTFSNLEVAFNFNYFKTHGYRAFIEEDVQTQLDRIFGSSASLAPAYTSADDEKYDVALNLKYKGFTLDGRYVDRERHLLISQALALTQKNISPDKDYYLNLGYEKSIREGLDFSGKVYRNVWDGTEDYQLLPPGVVLPSPTPTGFAIWEEGYLFEFSSKTSRTGIEIQTTYRISDSNTIVAGVTYEEQKWYDISVSANFLVDPDTGLDIKLPAVQKWPDDLVTDTQERDFKAVFLEDIWDITEDIRLTAGVRYDRYSDFGGEVSPRVGLTWEFIKGYDLKLLYGHAFRAPSFFELYDQFGGNPDLDAEKKDTFEASLGADFTSSFSSRGTFFYRVIEDSIVATSSVAPWNWANASGKWRDHGLEIEAKYDFGRGTYIAGNYSYLSFNDGPAVHLGDIMANIRLSKSLNFNVDCVFWDGFESTIPDDTRDDPAGHGVVSATLIAQKFIKGYERLELRGSVFNLLDKDFKVATPPQLPSDMAMPGRNYMVEAKYTF